MQPTARSTPQASSSTGSDADRVAQVEQHQRAGVVGDLGDPLGVGDPGGAVGDVAERHQRGLRPDHRRHLLRRHAAVGVDVDPAQGEPAARRRRPARRSGRSGSCRGRARSRCGPGARPRRPASACRAGPSSSRRRRSDPARPRARPARARRRPVSGRSNHTSSQPRISRVPHSRWTNSASAVPGLLQRAAERVAVEVDERAVGPDELLSVRRQRVGPVELLRVGHAPTLSADGLQVFATPDLHVSRRVARVRRDCFSARYV